MADLVIPDFLPFIDEAMLVFPYGNPTAPPDRNPVYQKTVINKGSLLHFDISPGQYLEMERRWGKGSQVAGIGEKPEYFR